MKSILFKLAMVIFPILFLPMCLRAVNGKPYLSVSSCISYFSEYDNRIDIGSDINTLTTLVNTLNSNYYDTTSTNSDGDTTLKILNVVKNIGVFFSNTATFITTFFKIIGSWFVDTFNFIIYIFKFIPYYISA